MHPPPLPTYQKKNNQEGQVIELAEVMLVFGQQVALAGFTIAWETLANGHWIFRFGLN